MRKELLHKIVVFVYFENWTIAFHFLDVNRRKCLKMKSQFALLFTLKIRRLRSQARIPRNSFLLSRHAIFCCFLFLFHGGLTRFRWFPTIIEVFYYKLTHQTLFHNIQALIYIYSISQKYIHNS